MAKLQLENVAKSYGTVEVIKNVSLDIADGEFVVFVGPSGCGKSTLLRMIAGLEEITDGHVLIDDEVCNDLAPKERGIAMVFQTYALYPHKTVYQNMAFSLKLSRRPRQEIDERIREAARILQMEHLLDRRPSQLSGGQRQRVAIGRAIVRNPKVFLFDEPLSNLDAALRVSMRREIAKLHEELEATMIYVTHDQVEAMTLADRIVVLDGGVVQQIGTPMELYHHPSNLFVAGFIGSPRMNLVPGRVAEVSGEALRIDTEEFGLVTVSSVDAGAARRVSRGRRVLADRPPRRGARRERAPVRCGHGPRGRGACGVPRQADRPAGRTHPPGRHRSRNRRDGSPVPARRIRIRRSQKGARRRRRHSPV